MNLNNKLKNNIENELNKKISNTTSLSGGCISNAYKIETTDNEQFFLKINDSNNDMFLKEADGLFELEKAEAIRIPRVFIKNNNFILLEFFQQGRKSKTFFEDFGRHFAQLHQYHSEHFGFYENNYIGSNPQKNLAGEDTKNNWINFYFKYRIYFQYKLAEKNGNSTDELKNGIKKLEDKIENILSGSLEQPSLLHGDLWGGNYMIDENGNAALIDPAVYYGHREADLGMTKLFGGFNSEFYKAYNEFFPLPDGSEFRENIYKLYHVLNHLNLFGRGYYSQALSLINYYI